MRRLLFLAIAALFLVAATAVMYLAEEQAVQKQHEGSDIETTAAAPAQLMPLVPPLDANEGNTGQAQDGPASLNSPDPSFDVVRIEPGGTAVIAGRGAPGSQVQILLDTQPWAETSADNRGAWVYIPDAPLQTGPHTLTLASAEGELSEHAAGEVIVNVPATEETRASGSATPAIAFTVDRTGQTPGRVLLRPSLGSNGQNKNHQDNNGQQPPDGFALEALQHDEHGRITITGAAPAGGLIDLLLNGVIVARLQADHDGRWTFHGDNYLAPGNYVIRAELLGTARPVLGIIEQSVAISYGEEDQDRGQQASAIAENTVGSAQNNPLATTTDNRIRIEPGSSLWRIAQKAYGSGWKYTLIFDANRQKIEDPDLIFPGQEFVVPSGD